MLNQPMIGVTSGLNSEESYLTLNAEFMNALTAAGAMPVILPLSADEALLRSYVERLDGFLFTGGGDVDPMRFGEAQLPCCGEISPIRDAHELLLAELVLASGKPAMGVCRGMQVLNVALGGTVYQDLPTQYGGELIAHRQTQKSWYPSHAVTVAEGSRLARITGCDRLMVNSLHHQAVRRAGAWNVCATAPDGVIEAAEGAGEAFVLGLQWHPERLWRTDAAHRSLFEAFVKACQA